MSNINYLEPVIRSVSEHATPVSPLETVVIIDCFRKQAIDKGGLVNNFLRDLKYFMVSNNFNGERVAKAAIRLPYTNGLTKDQKLFVILKYEVGCTQGNERLVAESLYNGPNPGVVFNDLLAKWVNEYLNARWGQFIEDFPCEKTNLQDMLAAKALREVGLHLDVKVSIDGYNELGVIVLGPVRIRVRFENCDEEEELQIKIEMRVDEQRVVKAILNQSEPLIDWLTKAVQKYFADKISLEAFCFDLNSDAVKQRLRGYLDEILKSFGRKVELLYLEAEPDVPRTFRKDLEIIYSHFAYPEPITIKSSMLMIPHNIVRYRAKKSPKLDLWVESTLKEIIDEVLFGVGYVNLLIGFEPLEKMIKEGMNREAEAIGFTVKQLITTPYLEPIDRLKRIDIEINKDEDEGLFETSIPDCSIRLGIAVTSGIKNLEGVSERLLRKQDIPEEMKRDIHTLVKQYIRAIDPERFYMRYFHTDAKQYPQEIPVERELSDKIVSLLKTDFCAEVIHLTLTRGKTQSTENLARLLKGSQDFKATLSLGDYKGSGTFVMTGTLRVEGVHHNEWKRFQERDSSLEKIKKRIEDSIQAELKPISTGLILSRSQKNLQKLKDKLLSSAKELILNEFGLMVDLSTVICSVTGIEEDRVRIARILEKIAKLEELHVDMLASRVSQEDVKGVKAQIEILKSLLWPEASVELGNIELPSGTELLLPVTISDGMNLVQVHEVEPRLDNRDDNNQN